MQTSSQNNQACAVRVGKLWLQSMAMEDLLSTQVSSLKQVVTVHSEMFVYAHEIPTFEAVLKRTVNTIDGRLLHALSSLVYPNLKLRKMAGSDFIYDLAQSAAANGERIFLLGAEPEANTGAVKVFRERYPHLVIEGYSPPFSSNIKDPAWNQDIMERIAKFAPAHIAVCFGPVKQEMWIALNADRLFSMGVRCAYGLGGTLDFVSGRKKRAPRWIQRIGAEWLYRVLKERSRVGRTLKMFKMPYFVFRFLQQDSRLLPQPAALAEASGAQPEAASAVSAE